MKFIITGSGGCSSIPKALCKCKICIEARKNGFPYARCGCSLYLEDISLLIDTPEDINIALNHNNISSLDYVFYSHWHTDHLFGLRIMEQINIEWQNFYENIKPKNKITVCATSSVMNDINKIRSPYGSFMDYYEHKMKIIKRQIVEDYLKIDDINITFLSVPSKEAVTIFIFESKGKKVVYAPCDCKNFPKNEIIQNTDILIIGETFTVDVLKDNKKIHSAHPLREELHSMEDIIKLKEQFNIKDIVITHIEEYYGKGFNDYVEMEKKYNNIKFAYDGMKIEI
jgi:phosphoribosyl 1,2-cyclic phosphate phosphodiesterase